MNENRTVRVYIEPEMSSRGRRSWTKVITAVDPSRKFGYSFLGEFLGAGQTDVPEGAILVRNSPKGSARKPRSKWTWTQVQTGKLRWSEPVDRNHFLDFRDQVTEALELAMAGGAEIPTEAPELWEIEQPPADPGDSEKPAKAPAKPRAKATGKATAKAKTPAKAQAKATAKTQAKATAKTQAKAQAKATAKAQAKEQAKEQEKPPAKEQEKAQAKPPAKRRKPRQAGG